MKRASKQSSGADRQAILRFGLQRLRRHPTALATLAGLLFGGVGLALVPPLFIRDYLGELGAGTSQSSLVLIALGFVLASLLVQVVSVFEGYMAEKLAWAVTNQLRLDATQHCLDLDMEFHDHHLPGELVERVDGDVSLLSNFLSRFIFLVLGQALLLVGQLVALTIVDWRVGLTLVPFSVLSLMALRRLATRGRASYTTLRSAAADLSGFMGERLGALADLRGSGAEEHTIGEFTALQRRLARAEVSAGQWGSIVLWAAASFLAWAATGIALGWSWWLLDRESISLPTAFLIFTYAQQMTGPMDKMAFQTQDYQAAAACVVRLQGLLDTPLPPPPAVLAVIPTGPVEICFDGVGFAYQPDHAVLTDISLRVPAGGSLGLVGRTGCGKSTLARLLVRLHDASSGEVLIGGVDITSVPHERVRDVVAFVSQEVQLLNATLRDNITFFDTVVDDEELVSALDRLGLTSWLSRLPQGLDTMLGPSGFSLSAGEEQLVALARIVRRDPQVVVLDEASARLDPVTERLLDTAIAELLRGRTSILIAHRLSTLRSVDEVAVMEVGRVVESGARAALSQNPLSRFAALLAAEGHEAEALT